MGFLFALQCLVQDNRWMQEQLVHLLVRYCSYSTAASWALQYHLPEESLHSRVADELKTLKREAR